MRLPYHPVVLFFQQTFFIKSVKKPPMTTAMSALMFFQLYTAIHHFIHKTDDGRAHYNDKHESPRTLHIEATSSPYGFPWIFAGNRQSGELPYGSGVRTRNTTTNHTLPDRLQPHGLRPLPKRFVFFGIHASHLASQHIGTRLA